jgi:hypothetical protein
MSESRLERAGYIEAAERWRSGTKGMVISLDLDPASALHLSRALKMHGIWCERHRHVVPDLLVELERACDVAKTWTQADTRDVVATIDNSDAPPFLTRRQMAARCGRSERTIRRWVAAGKLTAGPAGIPRSELERVGGLRAV